MSSVSAPSSPTLTGDPDRAKISSQTQPQTSTGYNVTGLDHVFLNTSSQHRPSTVSNETTRPVTRAPNQHQNDSFTDAIARLRNNVPPTSSTQNASIANPRVTFPALPPPPDTRPAARLLFRPSPNQATYSSNFRRPNLPAHFGPLMATTTSPTLHTPLPLTPDMSAFDAIEELNALFGKNSSPPQSPLHPCSAPREEDLPSSAGAGADSPSRNGEIELPDFGVFGPNGETQPDLPRLPSYHSLVANLILSQPEYMSTPLVNQTPSMLEASPDLELIAPIYASRKGVHGTPSMTPNLAMTPTLASPRTLAAGLIDIPGQFGFIEQPGGANLPSEASLNNFLQMFGAMDIPMMPPTVSPADLFTPTFTPGQPYTPGPLLDTPSVGLPSPLLETPGRQNVPLIASAHQAATYSAERKRPSPLNQTKAKRERSEEGEDSLSSKRRKHTGTRPGISSTQLLPPGAPPQLKTYLSESSTSRKDVPASYKVKAGEVPDDTIVNKIVAKRTANRDSARRSRQRKQQAMEFSQAQIQHYKDRCQQLEEFIREHGMEPPVAVMSPVMEPDEDVE